MKDIVAIVILGLLCLGWFNLGQGPEWTWWNLIAYIGEAYAH